MAFMLASFVLSQGLSGANRWLYTEHLSISHAQERICRLLGTDAWLALVGLGGFGLGVFLVTGFGLGGWVCWLSKYLISFYLVLFYLVDEVGVASSCFGWFPFWRCQI